MTPDGRLSFARTLRVPPHAAHASRPCPGAPFRTSGRARLVRLGVIILVVVAAGAAVLPMIFRQARGRRARCGTTAGRQWRWPARLRRAAGRTDPLLLFATLVLVVATLVLVVLTFLTLLAVDRSAGSADKAPTARWPCPAAAAQPAHPPTAPRSASRCAATAARCSRWRWAVLPDGTPVIVSGRRDGTVRAWRTADGTPLVPCTGPIPISEVISCAQQNGR